jgi:ATP-dependent Clp protease ATP-binding subunit ClpC
MTREEILRGLQQKFPFLFVPAAAYPAGPSPADLAAGLVRFTAALALASVDSEGIEDEEVVTAAAHLLGRAPAELPLAFLDVYLRRAPRQAVGLFGLDLRTRELGAIFLQDLRNLLAHLRRQGGPSGDRDAAGSVLADLAYFYLVNFKSELATVAHAGAAGRQQLVLARGEGRYLALDPFVSAGEPPAVEIALGADAEAALVETLPAAGPRRSPEPARRRAVAERLLRWGEYERARDILGGLRRAGLAAAEDPSLLAARYLTLTARSLRRSHMERAAFGVEQALRVRPDLAEAAYLLLSIYRRLGQPRRAEEMLRAFSERRPYLRRPLEHLGDLARQRGDFAEAARLYERALAIDPHSEAAAEKLQRLKARLAPVREAGAEEGAAERAGSRIQDLLEDLTAQAESGRFAPLRGREAELEQLVEILSCRQKKNPLIIGDAGVGKSALVEELARRMSRGEVPEHLARKRLFMMSVATLLAGAKYRGQFEERILELLRELREVDHVLYVDHLHTLINAGLTRGGGLDTSGLLKPALVRGEIQVIGSTTYDDYQNNIEKDPTLARSFQLVQLNEPDLTLTAEILVHALPRLQDHHKVAYDPAVVGRTLPLLTRVLHDGRLPDKAIDLMDRAGARVSLAVCSGRRADPRVGEGDILETLSGMARVPMAALSVERGERLARMEEVLAERVVGQSEAVAAVSRVLRANEQGFKLHPGRPNGVFLFLGPTGVGKTALARALAQFLFGDEERLVRIDMSEYMDRINSSRLIGSAPGYVGYNDQNQLTDAIRQHPYSLLLLDEIEKADAQLIQLFLQVFDAGRLTDGRGRTVRFHHTTVVMTSNVGSDLFLRDPVGYRAQAGRSGVTRAELMHQLRQRFSPEFLNRIDEIVFFEPLREEDMMRIARLELRSVREGLERQGRSLELEPEALRQLAREGYSFEFGARNLSRVLRRRVLEPLSRLALDPDWARTRRVRVRLSGERLEVVGEDGAGLVAVTEALEPGGAAGATLVPALEG